MPKRLSGNELFRVLERIRSNGMEGEADRLEEHLDLVSGEAVFLDYIRTLTEALTRANDQEAQTRTMLESWRPLIEKAAATLEKMAESESAAVEFEREKWSAEQEAKRETTGLKYKHVLGPAVAGLVGLLTGLAAAMPTILGGGAATP